MLPAEVILLGKALCSNSDRITPLVVLLVVLVVLVGVLARRLLVLVLVLEVEIVWWGGVFLLVLPATRFGIGDDDLIVCSNDFETLLTNRSS